jgi:alpha-methylacyl-CoA racemase
VGERRGPLTSLRVIELAGKGPAPFCAMVLADLGADVLRVERVPPPPETERIPPPANVMNRGRPTVAIDLKTPDGRATLLRLVEPADALVEGYRPGVMERLGVGPKPCLERNPRLVYGRMTGWGQAGPYAQRAGHDINYIGVNGVLSLIGPEGGAPVPPVNLLGDFGGGGMLLAVGVLAGVLEARRSGRGQVVDAAMIDGAALLTAALHGLRSLGFWQDSRGTNLLDGGAPFYGVYETSDGGFMSVGSLEPQFYARLLETLGLSADPLFAEPLDRGQWPEMRARLEEVFRGRTRADWEAAFVDVDACVAPVLGLDEAARDPHNADRGLFVEVDGVRQPAPAPRFSLTPAAVPRPPASAREAARAALAGWGLTDAEVDRLVESGVVVEAG